MSKRQDKGAFYREGIFPGKGCFSGALHMKVLPSRLDAPAAEQAQSPTAEQVARAVYGPGMHLGDDAEGQAIRERLYGTTTVQ